MEFMPSDDEGLRHWCRHQVEQLPRVGVAIGMTPAEITVFVESCVELQAALGGSAKKRKDPKKRTVRVKRTSLRRLVRHARTKPGYCEEAGRLLHWVGRGFGAEADAAHDGFMSRLPSVYSDAA